MRRRYVAGCKRRAHYRWRKHLLCKAHAEVFSRG